MAESTIVGCKVRLNPAGIIAVCKSGAMRTQLASIAEPIAAECNARAYDVLRERVHIHPDEVEVTPYQGGSKNLARTAIGYVNVRGLGKLVETIDHPLTSRNH